MRPGIRISWILSTVVVPTLAYLNWRHPVVRLTVASANFAFFLLAVLLPALGLWLALGFRLPWQRWVAGSILLPLALIGFLLAFLAGGELADVIFNGYANGLRPTDHLATVHGTLSAYDTDCGAPCDFGLLVRQENSIVPGLVLVREVYYRPGCAGGRLQAQADGRVRVLPICDGVSTSGPRLALVDRRWQVAEKR